MLGKLLALALVGGGGYWAYKTYGSPASAPAKKPAGGAVTIPLGVTVPTPAPAPPPAAPTYSGPMPPFDLSAGSTSGHWQTDSVYIRQYQGALTYLAWHLQNKAFDPGGVDGFYGPKTAAAVKAFQAAHGLTVDGKAGAQTDSAITLAVEAA